MRAGLVFISLTAILAIAMIFPSSGSLAQGTPSATPSTPEVCPVTLPGKLIYNVGNYGNDALSVNLWPGGVIIFTPDNGSPPGGPYSVKFPWRRWGYGSFTITGRRLDAPAPPLSSDIPSGYGAHGFQSASLIFPTLGCWEVTGHLGSASLTFVTMVLDISELPTTTVPATPEGLATPAS